MSAIHLTAREIDMLECLREGLENKNIAIRLGLTEATVKVHMRNLFAKLDVRNRVQAALWWDRRQDQRKEVLPALAAEIADKLQRNITEANALLAKMA